MGPTGLIGGRCCLQAPQLGCPLSPQELVLKPLQSGFAADLKTREAGLQASPDRIQELDASIHAWVQILPQKATGNGRLSGIPFGARDVFETKGLATEYGSPV